MYDRKTWWILGICGALLAANMYFSAQNQKQAQQAAAAEQVRKTDSIAARDLTGESKAQLSVEAPPPPTEEEIIRLASPNVIYHLTNVGGGVKYAEIPGQYQVGSKTELVRINRYGTGAIGTLFGADNALENIVYSYLKDQSVDGKTAVFVAKHPSGVIVRKTYSLVQGDAPGATYMLNLSVVAENGAAAPVQLSNWGLFLGEASPLYQSEVPAQTGFFWREDQEIHFNEATKFQGGFFGDGKSIIKSPADGAIEFAGVTNQFFTTIVQPVKPVVSDVWGKPADVALADGAKPVAGVMAGLRFPAQILQPGQKTEEIGYHIFTGPKHNPLLRKMESAWGAGWGDMMQYGWFSLFSRSLNWLLNLYHGWLDGFATKWAWGLAIILLTITVRAAIWPLHAKSTRTMKRMSKLKPEMDKLKEKYPDDPNKLNTEMMGLYRKYGINPVGGCLPMLLQIPIFFGFYKMLQYAVELRGQPFLWVHDLSQPDTLTHIAGIPINILPIVMAITSFLQIKMTPSTGDKMQQRIMMMMPFIFFFFCYNFASALALYWTTQNIFSILQTWLMNKVPEPELKPVSGPAKKSWVQRLAEQQAEMQRRQQEGQGGGMRDVTPDSQKKRKPRTGG